MSERNYERINDLPEGITPVTGAELVELEQDGVSRKFSMTALAGITNPHEETHQRGGADAIGTLERTAYAIPYLESDGTIDTRVSDASTTKKGKVQLATDGEESATKPPASTDSRLKDKRDPTEHAIEHVAGADVIPNATITVPGLMSATDKVKAEATIPEYIPTEDQKAALAGSYGTPSETNRYVTEQDPILEGIGGSGAVGGNTLIGVGALGIELPVDGVGIGYAGMARLSENLIAFFHKDVGELKTYQRTGATWSQVGSGLTISGAGDVAMAAFSSIRIIFIDSGNKELRTYLWSGSAWSLSGTSPSIAGLGTPSIAVLTSTKIALVDSGNEELRTYELSGTEWSLAGTSFSIPGLGTPSIISLGLSDVALLGSGTGLLSKYRNLSNIWTKIGNSTSIYNVGALARLNATDISVVNNYSAGNSVIMAYRWVDTIYEKLEKDFYISGSFITTVPLDLNEIALFDATTDKLRIYSFLFGYDSASVNVSADYEVPEIDNRKSIIVRRTSAYDGNPVTITPPSGATFEGLASIALYGQYSYVELERISATVFAVKDEKSLASFIAPVDCTSRVAEYTGDGIPLIPDNVAGRTYFQDEWATVDGFVTAQGTLSVASGCLRVVTSANPCLVIKDIGALPNGKTWIYRLRGTSGAVVSMRYYNGTTQIAIDSLTLDGTFQTLKYHLPAGATNNNIYLHIASAPGTIIDLDTIYIGTGAYDTPALDRAGNGNSLTLNAVTPVNGKYCKEMSFNGFTSFGVDKSPIVGTSGTLIMRWKRNRVGTAETLISNQSATTDGLRYHIDASNNLYAIIGGSSPVSILIKSGFTDKTSSHVFGIKFSASSVTPFYDGVYGSAVSATQVLGIANFAIGRNQIASTEHASGQGFYRYDSRIWTADEARAWSMNPISIDSRV